MRTAALKTTATRRAVNDATDRTKRARCKRKRSRRHNGTRQRAHERLEIPSRGGDRLEVRDLAGAPASSGRFSSFQLTANPWVGSGSRSTKVGAPTALLPDHAKRLRLPLQAGLDLLASLLGCCKDHREKNRQLAEPECHDLP